MAIATADEIRARLQKTEAELSDETLNSASFIPAAEAWLSKYVTYANLDATDKALAKAAVIAYTCARVVAIAPQAGSKWGPMAINDLKASEIAASAKAFKEEADDLLGVLGAEVGSGWFAFSGQGGDDYEDASEDFD